MAADEIVIAFCGKHDIASMILTVYIANTASKGFNGSIFMVALESNKQFNFECKNFFFTAGFNFRVQNGLPNCIYKLRFNNYGI